MAEYIDIAQLWNCETCFHHQNGKCSPSVWRDHGESYRPAYDKLKKADVVEVPQEYACYTDFNDENFWVNIAFPISEKQFKALGEGADLWKTLRMDGDG